MWPPGGANWVGMARFLVAMQISPYYGLILTTVFRKSIML